MLDFSEKLTPSLVKQFQEDGAVCLRGVFSQHWLEVVKKGIKKNVQDYSAYAEWLKASEKGGAYFNDYCNWRKIPEFEGFVMNSPAAEIVGTLMDSKSVSFYHDHVLIKEPGAQKVTPWHQDQPYYPIDGFKVCSIWLPVDSVSLDTTLRFVQGSHRWGRWFIPRKFATSKNYIHNHEDSSLWKHKYEDVSDAEIESGKYKILEWALEPGDCLVFHMLMLHGAHGNPTKIHRRVLSTRWLGDDAAMAMRPWEVSPPTYGGLKPGEPAISEEFPLVWQKN